MTDLKEPFDDIQEILFPATGEGPYELSFLDMDEAAAYMDGAATVSGKMLEVPDKPQAVIVYRGRKSEPLVILHGYEFLRLLKGSGSTHES